MEDVFLAAVTTDVVMELSDRKGFDDWWYNIDEDIRAEIESALAERVRATMRAFKVRVG